MPSLRPTFETKSGFKFFGGYEFRPVFAREGGLADPRRFDAMRDAAAFGPTAARASGFRLDAVGIVPLRGGFSLFGRIGTLYLPSRSSIFAGGSLLAPAYTDPSQVRYEWNVNYSLGASYHVSNSIGLQFKYERANSYFGDARMSDSNVGIWSLGLIKRY